MTDNEKWYWLYSTKGAGKMTAAKLAEKFEDINELYDNIQNIKPEGKRQEKAIEALIAAKKSEAFRREFEQFRRRGVRLLTRQKGDLPKSVLDVKSIQYLYVMGSVACLDEPCAAIVGSREPSLCGSQRTYEIARELAERGVTVISGLARGIDTCAHEGALSGKGKTAAVLAGGVYPVYPAKNELLYAEILQSGGAIVSENPPCTYNYPQLFTARNAVISALSQAVAVMEGGETSGARSTAEAARKQGRVVFALHGQRGEYMSELPRMLLEQGARPVLRADDIIQSLRAGKIEEDVRETIADMSSAKKKKEEPKANEISPEERAVLAAFEGQAMTIDEISEKTGLDMVGLMPILLTLELDGRVTRLGTGYTCCI